MRPVPVIALLAASVWSAACSPECSLVGCTSSIAVDLVGIDALENPSVSAIRACVDAKCVEFPVTASGGYAAGNAAVGFAARYVRFEDERGLYLEARSTWSLGTHAVSVQVLADGATLYEGATTAMVDREFYPNGEECDRVPCRMGSARITGE